MITNINIEILSNPEPFEVLMFTVENTALSYSKNYFKKFIEGIPIAESQVKIGIDKETTLLNLIDNLNNNDNDGSILFEILDGNVIIQIVHSVVGNYTVNVVSDAGGSFTVMSELLDDVIVPEENTIEFNQFSIEIIDTYDNDFPLVDEFTQINAPRLIYDGGDTLDSVIFSSSLKFNMLVEGGIEGKFKHLFSGDENRFLVKLNAIGDDDSVQLIWQGFLLTDEQKEPYVTGSYFVDFEAVDMLGALKNVYIEKWMYRNRFPIMKIIALLCEKTNLNQSFNVAPTFIPAAVNFSFKDINVPIDQYAKDDDYKDCYTILNDILEANGFCIYSYKGVFNLVGISRRKDVVLNSLVFDVDGNYTSEIIINREQKDIYFIDKSASISAISPFKEVTVSLKPITSGTILPEDFVQAIPEYIQSINKVDQVEALGHIFRYQTRLFTGWNRIGGLAPVYSFGNGLNISYYNPFTNYGMSEAGSMINYYEFSELFYIKKNTDYNLEIEGLINMITNSDTLETNLSNFLYKYNFQIIMDGTEIASSRFNYFNYSNFLYEVTDGNPKDENGFFDVKYKLKTTFSSNFSGNIKIRMLAPLFEDVNDFADLFVKIVNTVTTRFVIAPKSSEELEDTVTAIRPVSFTTAKKVDLNYISTKNIFFKNNFGIGYSINSNYENIVSFSSKVVRSIWQFSYTSSAFGTLRGKINIHEYVIDKIYELFGSKNLKKNLFKESSSGEKIYFDKLGCKLDNKMIYIESIEDNPVLPKNYGPMPQIETGDSLKYYQVKYGAEDISKRNEWLIYGSDVVDSFIKNHAKLHHFLNPKVSHSIEGTAIGLFFPDNLGFFYYNELDRKFIPTRLELDLTADKTDVKMQEDVFEFLNDITYE